MSELDERAVLLAEYIIENGATVRAAAAHFGISKSTVHKDLTERLEQKNRELWQQTREILDRNKAERHLRGGEATRRKYVAMERLRKRQAGVLAEMSASSPQDRR